MFGAPPVMKCSGVRRESETGGLAEMVTLSRELELPARALANPQLNCSLLTHIHIDRHKLKE